MENVLIDTDVILDFFFLPLKPKKMINSFFRVAILINTQRFFNGRPRPTSRKISENGVKNRPCLKLKFVMRQ